MCVRCQTQWLPDRRVSPSCLLSSCRALRVCAAQEGRPEAALLPHLPFHPLGFLAPGDSRSSSPSDSEDTSSELELAAGPAGAYHAASAESMDDIPVAQTRLGSAALAAPGAKGREPGLALQARAPAVFVSLSSGEAGAPGGEARLP